MTAVYRKEYDSLRTILKNDFNVNTGDKEDGITLLMYAILAANADSEMVKFLIQCGADVNIQDRSQKYTALHFAARDQREDIVKVLLENGAEVNAQDKFGNTPLSECVTNNSPNLNIVRMLLKEGADPNKQNNYENSAMDTARKIGNMDLINLLKET